MLHAFVGGANASWNWWKMRLHVAGNGRPNGTNAPFVGSSNCSPIWVSRLMGRRHQSKMEGSYKSVYITAIKCLHNCKPHGAPCMIPSSAGQMRGLQG